MLSLVGLYSRAACLGKITCMLHREDGRLEEALGSLFLCSPVRVFFLLFRDHAVELELELEVARRLAMNDGRDVYC